MKPKPSKRTIGSPHRSAAALFLRDFLSMEQAIASGVSVPVERMVVELGLNPRNLRSHERMAGISMAWAKKAFQVMKRHDLMPASKSWADWLQRYVDAKHAALKELAPV